MANVRAIEDAFVPVIKLEFEEVEVTRILREHPVRSLPFSFLLSLAVDGLAVCSFGSSRYPW